MMCGGTGGDVLVHVGTNNDEKEGRWNSSYRIETIKHYAAI